MPISILNLGLPLGLILCGICTIITANKQSFIINIVIVGINDFWRLTHKYNGSAP